MLVWIVMLQDGESKIVTDIVGFSDVVKAGQCAHDLSRQFGRENVSETSLIVDALPVYFGLVQPKAAEQSVQPTAAGGSDSEQNSGSGGG